MSSWLPVLQRAAHSIGLDVLLFLIEDVSPTGYYRAFSVRTLAARTARAHTRVAKVVRRLEQLDLIHLAKAPRPGRSLEVRLHAQAPLNCFLLKGLFDDKKTSPVFQIPEQLQHKLAEVHRTNQKLQAQNTHWQATIEQLARKRVADFYRAGFDFARISNKLAERLEKEWPAFALQDAPSFARQLEPILEEIGHQDVEEYLQVLCEG